MRIFEHLEKLIKTLKSIKATRDAHSEGSKATEKSIMLMLHSLVDLITKIEDLQEFVFPYFGDLLESTSDPVILKDLISLALAILKNPKYKDSNISHIVKLSAFLIPFTQMIKNNSWDLNSLKTTLTLVSKENCAAEEVSSSLKDLILSISKNGPAIVKSINDQLLLKTSNPSLCKSKLITTVCEETFVARNEAVQQYWKVIGEITLVSYIFEPNFDERVISLILMSHCFQSKFLLFIEN